MEAHDEAAGASVPPPLVFFIGFILGSVISYIFPIRIFSVFWLQLLGLGPLVIGVSLLVSAGRAFARHKASFDPWEPTRELVMDGPYRFTRNPIYLSFTLIYLGASLVENSLVTLTILIPATILVDRKQILREERYLEKTFGKEYNRYRSKVRRWL